jgi:hypothetical protein
MYCKPFLPSLFFSLVQRGKEIIRELGRRARRTHPPLAGTEFPKGESWVRFPASELEPRGNFSPLIPSSDDLSSSAGLKRNAEKSDVVHGAPPLPRMLSDVVHRALLFLLDGTHDRLSSGQPGLTPRLNREVCLAMFLFHKVSSMNILPTEPQNSHRISDVVYGAPPRRFEQILQFVRAGSLGSTPSVRIETRD